MSVAQTCMTESSFCLNVTEIALLDVVGLFNATVKLRNMLTILARSSEKSRSSVDAQNGPRF